MLAISLICIMVASNNVDKIYKQDTADLVSTANLTCNSTAQWQKDPPDFTARCYHGNTLICCVISSVNFYGKPSYFRGTCNCTPFK